MIFIVKREKNSFDDVITGNFMIFFICIEIVKNSWKSDGIFDYFNADEKNHKIASYDVIKGTFFTFYNKYHH